jgi:Domain of unknown function (DUF1835)
MKNIILTHSLSAGGTIRQLFRKIRPDWQTSVFASYDDFSHGPLSISGTSNDFFLKRQAFWKSLDLYDVDMALEFDLSDEHIALTKEIQTAKQAEIWIANSVQDVFYAVVILHLLTLDGVDTSGISVRNFSGQQVKWGLGALQVEELESLYKYSEAAPFDTRLYRDAWTAISQGSGEAIKRFITGQNLPTPMAKALSAYLLRFPDFNSGLGSIERALLGAGTIEMKKSAYTVGNAMALGEPENDQVGDCLLFKKLVELSAAEPNPWFKLEGDSRHMRSCSAQITESGREARAKYSVLVL